MVPWQIPIIFANWKKPWGQLKSTTKRCLQIVIKVGRRRGKDQRWDGWMVDTRYQIFSMETYKPSFATGILGGGVHRSNL